MISKLQLLRNVGQFDSVAAGAKLPLGRFVLVYAENGRGKTTLAAILRSLATGDAIPLSERRRLSAQNPPHVVIECNDGQAIFQNAGWNRTIAGVSIFDDAFVDDNMYSGLAVDAQHRQNLHEFILGAQGVSLHRTTTEIAAKVEAHNAELRKREAAIPAAVRAGIAIDEFCQLPANADIEQVIDEIERKVAAIREQEPIRRAKTFDQFALPEFDVAAITTVLKRDLPSLNAAAVDRVQQHLAVLGSGGERWLSDGLQRVPNPPHPNSEVCPFCVQTLDASTIIAEYRAFFSADYERLTRSVAESIAAVNRQHAGDTPASFERAVRLAVERQLFWSRFCNVPNVALDTADIVRVWREAREGVVGELEAKRAAPLEPRTLPKSVMDALAAFESRRAGVSALSESLQAANVAVLLVKEQATSGALSALEGDLARAKATKARHSEPTASLCARYMEEKAAKAATEVLRENARVALNNYRANVFPKYQNAANGYLQRFNAGFRIDSVKSVDTRGGTSCTYNVIIDSQPVPIAGGTQNPGSPSFRNTLSAGDRNTLALAFFFSSLDQEPSLATKIVVIDDPISSLDEHRSLTTVQEVRRLAERAGQLIVLSHDKKFLARIWESADSRVACTAVQIVRDGQGSTLESWDVSAEATTEYDRRHSMLREYVGSRRGDAREVAAAIRPVLEGFVRVARPEHFPAGTLLGPFLGICDQRVGRADEVFDSASITTLREILEYANRFHHDTNSAWDTESINDGELRGFVQRTLAFVR